MYFIDRDRRAQGVDTITGRGRTLDGVKVNDDGCRLRAYFALKGNWIGFQRQQPSILTDNLVFIMVTGLRPRDEDFPETVAAHPHRVAAAVPEIEIADDAHALGTRRKEHEADAWHAIERHRMRAELLVKMHMRAFGEEIEI